MTRIYQVTSVGILNWNERGEFYGTKKEALDRAKELVEEEDDDITVHCCTLISDSPKNLAMALLNYDGWCASSEVIYQNDNL